MLLCHKDHPLAAIEPISWPESRFTRFEFRAYGSNEPPVDTIPWPQLRVRNHPTAPTEKGSFGPQTNQLNRVLGRDMVVYVKHSTHTDKTKTENPAKVGEWFGKSIGSIWPVADGSLSLRKSPCVRANCLACAAGEGHRSYVLYGRNGKKRFSIYVPEDLVPEVKAAMENGRRLKELISEAGLRYTQALKAERRRRAPAEPKRGQ